MEEKFEELAEGYITNKVGISVSFLTEKLSVALAANVHLLNKDGDMMMAGISNMAHGTDTTKIRSDKTKWLEADTKNEAEMEFLEIIRLFTLYLNKTCYTGLNAFEFHYALYEEGSFYGRHKDQFRNDSNRKFSMISYLNENWQQAEGGQLILHHDGKAAQNILPEGGKTVFFKSDELEHEVAVATRDRMSVTGWLKQV